MLSQITSLRRRWARGLAAALFASLGAGPALAAGCPAEQPGALVPTDAELCRYLAPVVADPSALPLGEYEEKLGLFLRNFCHRDTGAGWVRDKAVRDTGPFTTVLQSGSWKGTYNGTHAPVVIWYSPDMAQWIRDNRGPDDENQASDDAPAPDGAMMIKEMYPHPAALCADVDPLKLLPTSGAAVMIRDSKASQDGWFWGWFGWSGWDPDYPASNETNRLAYMGFGQYCMNCHASARDNLTFASAKNMQGEPGRPLVFLSQDEGESRQTEPHHLSVVLPEDDAARLGTPHQTYSGAFAEAFPPDGTAPSWADVPKMPSETYDNVWMRAGPPDGHGEYLTSDQCLGCHDAGSTGLQFDMTKPATGAHAGKLLNLSPYATWRNSPMGLAGRDPIFFAQLASETQSFHPDEAGAVANTCLGCHGIMGQRQFGIDNVMAGEACGEFGRELVDAVPYPPGNPQAEHADYGALARDGISCTTCHRMVLGEEATKANADHPRNACVLERQAFLNPDEQGFGKTFTGSFLVGPADRLYGPYKEVKTAPMETALGITPEHNATIQMSETCGTCHTVHLPVFDQGKTVGRVYEQLTYPEWAFSSYRTGTSPDGQLPFGQGERWQSCQDCHMPSKEADGSPSRSRIASIQEYSNFPQAEFTKEPDEIDLPIREHFSRHTLVGLNVFLLKMAQQFPDVLGIRTQDPMLTTKGVDPLVTTEQQMLDQARHATAKLSVSKPSVKDGTLSATVSIENLVGHKFPSGVGFRRAFVTFEVLDRLGATIWSSGASDAMGRIVDAEGEPIEGELWWEKDCSARIAPLERRHQPHYQEITSETQAQIYQELVSTPPPAGSGQPAQCGHTAKPEGQLTTSFLSICAEVKDNRLLPHGFLPEAKREKIAQALGAGDDMAEDAGSTAVGDDPDYQIPEDGSAGKDSLDYRIPVKDIRGEPVAVRASLNYQATPPFYLQDRFCTAKGPDRDRLYFLTGHLNLNGTEASGWKLTVADSGMVRLAGE
jgi:hypothetical protein